MYDALALTTLGIAECRDRGHRSQLAGSGCGIGECGDGRGLLLGVRLAEITLIRRHDLTGDQRRRAWLRRVVLRAGARPLEDLSGFPVGADQISCEAAPGTLCGHVSVVECKIGPMRLRCEVEHPADDASPREDAYFASEEDVLGNAGGCYYGEGFTLRRQNIRDLEVAPELCQLRATVHTSLPDGIHRTDEDLGARYQPAFSMLNCLVTSAQLAQVFLYHKDGLDRVRTNTLWLRKVVLETTTPYHALAPFDVSGLAHVGSRTAGQTSPSSPEREHSPSAQ